MHKSSGLGERIIQIVTTLGAVAIGYIVLSSEKTHFNVDNMDKCDNYKVNLSSCTNFGLLVKDPPETEYVVLKALDNKVSSNTLMANMATLLSDKLAASGDYNVDNIKDLSKFIPHILDYQNVVNYSNNNNTVSTYVKLLKELLEGRDNIYLLTHYKTPLEKLISLKTCDAIINKNFEGFIHGNPFVKIAVEDEYSNIYTSNLINIMVKSAIYEYIERVSINYGKIYSLWWKENVSNAVARIFTMNMENSIISSKNLASFGKELEATLISLGQFIFLDMNQDGSLSADEMMNIFSVPSVDNDFPFMFSLFKVATYRYGFAINMFEFIIFKFSLRITDDIASAKLSNIVRL